MISCVTLQHACSTQFWEYFTERPRRLVSCKTTTRHEDNPRTWLTQGNSNDTTYKRAPVVLFDDRYPIACSSIAIRSDLENEARRPSGFEKEIHRLDKHPCEIRRVISRENSTRNVQSTRWTPTNTLSRHSRRWQSSVEKDRHKGTGSLRFYLRETIEPWVAALARDNGVRSSGYSHATQPSPG